MRSSQIFENTRDTDYFFFFCFFFHRKFFFSRHDYFSLFIESSSSSSCTIEEEHSSSRRWRRRLALLLLLLLQHVHTRSHHFLEIFIFRTARTFPTAAATFSRLHLPHTAQHRVKQRKYRAALKMNENFSSSRTKYSCCCCCCYCTVEYRKFHLTRTSSIFRRCWCKTPRKKYGTHRKNHCHLR